MAGSGSCRWAAYLLVPLLAGCVSPEPTGALQVFVVHGTVAEEGPAVEPGGVCDMAAPPWSWDPAAKRLWILEGDRLRWQDPVWVVVRYDRIEEAWDDGCWAPGLQQDAAPVVQVYEETSGRHVELAHLPLEEGAHVIEASLGGMRHGKEGTWRYQGTLQIEDLGAWKRSDVRLVQDARHLPETPWSYP